MDTFSSTPTSSKDAKHTISAAMLGQVVRNKKVILKDYTHAKVNESDMEVREGKICLQLEGDNNNDVLVKNLYLSPDPYMRSRMKGVTDSYIPPFTPGEPLDGFGVSKVVLSNNPNFKEDDYVTSWLNWEEYSLIPGGERLKVVDDSLAPLSYHLGCLGMPGFTAYVGLYEILKPKKGETIFVSAASGAVGQIVGQLAKAEGLYVVGSAGSQEKIDLLKNKLGYDAAFNYKEEPDLVATLRMHCPRGIDMDFENVGGQLLDAVLENVNVGGRIAVCGLISEYDSEQRDCVTNLYRLITQRVTMQGFLQSDYAHLRPKFMALMSGYLEMKKLVIIEDFAEGLENAPTAFCKLMDGRNVGKQIVRVAAD